MHPAFAPRCAASRRNSANNALRAHPAYRAPELWSRLTDCPRPCRRSRPANGPCRAASPQPGADHGSAGPPTGHALPRGLCALPEDAVPCASARHALRRPSDTHLRASPLSALRRACPRNRRPPLYGPYGTAPRSGMAARFPPRRGPAPRSAPRLKLTPCLVAFTALGADGAPVAPNSAAADPRARPANPMRKACASHSGTALRVAPAAAIAHPLCAPQYRYHMRTHAHACTPVCAAFPCYKCFVSWRNCHPVSAIGTRTHISALQST